MVGLAARGRHGGAHGPAHAEPDPAHRSVGTLLLPLLERAHRLGEAGAGEPRRFRRAFRWSTGDIIVSAAGPLSNLAPRRSSRRSCSGSSSGSRRGRRGPAAAVLELLQRLMIVNAGLAIFNLLPIPPLDGSHVAGRLVPYRFRAAWEQFARLSPFFLLALIFFGRGHHRPADRRFVFGLL